MESVRFTEEKATMLATLYGRAIDARQPEPVLGDRTALDAVNRIDYDFSRFKMSPDMALTVALRALILDRMTEQFVAAHPDAVVVHLGCGLDSRVYRIDPPETVRWYDVDYPETIDLRSRIYPDRRGYRMIGSSVTDLDWLSELPTDRPAFVVAEGLTMYLDPMGGPALLSALVHTLPTGEMAFDAFSRLGIRLSKLNTVVRRADATLHWGIDDAAELRPLGLEPIEVLQAPDFVPPEYADRLSRSLKLQLWITEHVPALRRMGQIFHLSFGPSATLPRLKPR